MRKWLPYLIALAAVALLVYTTFKGQPKDTPEGRHADTVIAEDPALRDSLEAVAESLRVYQDSTKLVKKEKLRWKAKALDELAVNDSMRVAQERAPTMQGKDSVIRHLRFIVIPDMQRVWHSDSVTIFRQDSTILGLTRNYNRALVRGDTLLVALDKLRQATKPPPSIKIPVIGLRVSLKDAAYALAGYCIGGGNPC